MAPATKAALAIIDFQNDFCPPNGTLAVEGGRDIARTINELLSYPFALKLATRDFHPADHISFASQHPGKQPFTSEHTIVNPENAREMQRTWLWPDHCVQGTPGCELVDELDKSKLDLVVDKGMDKPVESYSAFGPPFRSPRVAMSGLEDTLRRQGITDLFVVGIAWDYCVRCSAVDAVEHGFRTYVIEEATRGVDRSADGHAATRKALQDAGVHVIGLDAEELQELRTSAGS
ncbi:Isochorismatase hydrolase [Teratosphaeria destructans]|uniref:nicotinamidase n=1 Tax=Teratosphaeria destructans TaxID=418781 RepID=A0A9W7W388_9PEZI|nr:Isochorismatase hydrolase [Teratosphaeria destructans]